MAGLPSQGGNTGTWGTDLNAYLNVEHSSTGTHGTITALVATGATVTNNLTAGGTVTGVNVSGTNFNIVSYENAAVFYEDNIVTV